MQAGGSFGHRREIVAFRTHAEVRQALLLHRAVVERIVERTDRMEEGPAAIKPRAERSVAYVVVIRLAPRGLLALLRIRGKLLRRRVGLDPFHRCAPGGGKGERCEPESSHTG